MFAKKQVHRILLPLMLLFVMLFPSAVKPAMAQEEGPGVERSSRKPVFDKHFIDFMVPHHQSAIEMAKIALERANHEEIREMARMEIETQTEEIEKMKAWREEWYGSDETPPITAIPTVPETGEWELGMTEMNMEPMIEKLRNAPEPFDLVFIDLMIKHHMDAIEASLAERHHDEHEELYDLAKKIVKEQHRSINEMSELRDQWYFNPDNPLCPDEDPCPVGNGSSD